jgi:hypothetical protein
MPREEINCPQSPVFDRYQAAQVRRRPQIPVKPPRYFMHSRPFPHLKANFCLDLAVLPADKP